MTSVTTEPDILDPEQKLRKYTALGGAGWVPYLPESGSFADGKQAGIAGQDGKLRSGQRWGAGSLPSIEGTGFDAASSKRIVEGNIRWVIAPQSSSRQFEARLPG